MIKRLALTAQLLQRQQSFDHPRLDDQTASVNISS
jgi:hypothetical protein